MTDTLTLAISKETVQDESQLKEHISTLPTQQLEQPRRSGERLFWQLLRFGTVGGLNTGIDILIFNVFLWIGPTQNTTYLLAYNSLAYAIGAINSFILNKYWTFQHKQHTTYGEVFRFAITTCCGILCNDVILWVVGTFLHPVMINATVWANASKILAISGTFMLSFLGMRLWVFTHRPGKKP